jgi:hypothetical protein
MAELPKDEPLVSSAFFNFSLRDRLRGKRRRGEMKKIIRIMALVLSFCLLTWSGYSDVEASQYLGDFCWEIHEATGVIGILKLGVFSMGGDIIH